MARYHRGSCLAGPYELRVTARCLAEDLGMPPATPFCDARAHPIVAAFEAERSKDPGAGKTVGPSAGNRTLFRLAVGHDHRGATWYDEVEGVVWLCAYGRHRSGQPDDAFPHFAALRRSGRVEPTVDDYEVLFVDRDRRFVETVFQDAQALLAAAQARPGEEHAALLGGRLDVAVVVEAVEGLEEVYVAFSVANIDHREVLVVLEAFFPYATFSAWELVEKLPTRPLKAEDSEICYRILWS